VQIVPLPLGIVNESINQFFGLLFACVIGMMFKNAILQQTSIPYAARGLDAQALRGKAVANNMANVTTPGYQRLEVQFESLLREHLDGNRVKVPPVTGSLPKVFSLPEAQVHRSKDPVLPGEVNNVDIDLEMANLAETQLAYMADVKTIKDRMTDITSAIRGR
jgi:flagellar basal-body rod protein FlgB